MEKYSTLPELLEYIYKYRKHPKAFNLLQKGNWISMSTETFHEAIINVFCGLKDLGVSQKDGFGIISDSSPQWVMMDLACIATGAYSIPMFANISFDNLKFEIKNSNMKYLFVAGENQWQMLKPHIKYFKKIITLNIKEKGKNIIDLDTLIKNGAAISKRKPDLYFKHLSKINENDIATIIYTSGSTGLPKGVELSHKNLVSQTYACAEAYPLYPESDTMVSCLPLAHIFERMVIYYYISTGCPIYFADDIKNVGEIVRDVHPTLMTMVPRLLEKVMAKMKNKAEENKGIKRKLALNAIERAINFDPEKDKPGVQDLIYKKLVYKKLVEALGGKLKSVIVGGAKLPDDIDRFFINIGIPLRQGYGLTEASPVIAANTPIDNKMGTVGKPFKDIQVKIAEDGELLAFGPNIMKGYHKAPKETAKTIDKNGWLHTGDLASIDKEGNITITGRKKELFKTSQGKYVSPLHIEFLLSKIDIIDTAMVIAENKKFVSCLLFPDSDKIKKYKKKFDLLDLNEDDFLNNDKFKNYIKAEIDNVNTKLNHWEQIHKFIIINQPISIETGELTPTMKLRRHIIEELYSKEIKNMYN